jgi:hypothetical protein
MRVAFDHQNDNVEPCRDTLPGLLQSNELCRCVKVPRRLREEEAIVWLWANPQVLPWPKSVAWLFSPVNNLKIWPGDLWGVDSDGELLIVESKLLKKAKFYDPFADFCDYCLTDHIQFCGAYIKAQWKTLREAEIASCSRLYDRGTHKLGILPNSSNNLCLRCWSVLTRRIEKYVRHPKYESLVCSHLKARIAAMNPKPHYCGLLLRPAGEGQAVDISHLIPSIAKLKLNAGADRVHTFVVTVSAPNATSFNVSFRKCLA